MTPKDFTVGQKLVAVYTLNRLVPLVRDVEVVAIGRRWVGFYAPGTYFRERFDPGDMAIDPGDFTSSGRVYLSHEDYARAQRARKVRDAIRREIGYGQLNCVPLDDLEAAAMLLGVEVGGDAQG